MPANTLAVTYPDEQKKDWGASQRPFESSTFYPVALANFLKGGAQASLRTGSYDMTVGLNAGANFYNGTDANPGTGQIDLVTTILHEVLHGLGFVGSVTYNGNSSEWQYGTDDNGTKYPWIYDRFIEGQFNGTELETLSFTGTSTDNLLSGFCVFNGTKTNTANSSSDAWLEQNGGSPDYFRYIYEIDPAQHPGELGVGVSGGPGNHKITPITKAMLEDMGWIVECPVGLEDRINITDVNWNNPPIDLVLNTNYLYRAQFIDNPPYGDYLTSANRTWELRLFHQNGYHTVATSTNFDFNLTVSSLPTGFIWKRNTLGQIMGQVIATGIDNDNIPHKAELEIRLGYKPDIPMVSVAVSGGASGCANANLEFYGRGATSYNITTRESLTNIIWGATNGATSSELTLNNLDESKNYNFEVVAINPWGVSQKTITRTKCTFPISISPNPAYEDLHVRTLDDGELCEGVTIISVNTGEIVYDQTFASPVEEFNVMISNFQLGMYILQVTSENDLTATAKFNKE